VLAHELRNPLAPVRTALEILQRQRLTEPRARKSVDILVRQVGQMTRLVDDLLDVSRISSGKVHLERALVDLPALVRTVVDDHRVHADEHALSITLELPDGPVHVLGDEIRLSQALGNVLSNAIKFTPPGGS